MQELDRRYLLHQFDTFIVCMDTHRTAEPRTIENMFFLRRIYSSSINVVTDV